MDSRVRAAARNGAGGVFHKQSRALLCREGLNGRPGICEMGAVILMVDPRLRSIVRAYSSTHGKVAAAGWNAAPEVT